MLPNHTSLIHHTECTYPTFSMTSQLEILAPDFFSCGSCTDTLSRAIGFRYSPAARNRSSVSLTSDVLAITLIVNVACVTL